MQGPEDVEMMLRLHALGWGTRRIASELGVSRNTVRRYLRQGGWQPYGRPRRQSQLDGLEAWLLERFLQHGGNADVVRQELATVHGIEVSLRTVERAVKPHRELLKAQARATVRFETRPGRQLQIDFGTVTVEIDGERVRVKLFVATLGYSRRLFVRATRHERQSAWLEGIEGAFRHFGGVPEELLLDNARALVKHHDLQRGEVVFNDRFDAFCRHWGVRPRACRPYRARTKGKDERMVGYVKRNAIAGRTFASWEALEAHLAGWTRCVADQRVHGTTGEVPAERFARDEAVALRPLAGRPPFQQRRELQRRVGSDLCVEVDTNAYSVPWRLIGADVTVQVHGGRVEVWHAGDCVAEHAELSGQRRRSIERRHLDGVVRVRPAPVQDAAAPAEAPPPRNEEELRRDLQAYADAIGGGW
jgi:transposase